MGKEIKYRRGKDIYTLVKISVTDQATWYKLRGADGEEFSVGKKILLEHFKEIKDV